MLLKKKKKKHKVTTTFFFQQTYHVGTELLVATHLFLCSFCIPPLTVYVDDNDLYNGPPELIVCWLIILKTAVITTEGCNVCNDDTNWHIGHADIDTEHFTVYWCIL